MPFEYLKKFVEFLLFGFCVYKSALPFFEAASKTGGLGDAVAVAFSTVVISLLWGALAAVLFVLFFLPGISDSIAATLIYKRHFLRRPPPLLSAIHGEIGRRNYEVAEFRLRDLLRDYPFSPEIWSLLFEIELDGRRDRERAIAVLCEYLGQEEREPGAENFKMLNSGLEILFDNGENGYGAELVAAELRLHPRAYTPRERRILTKRVAPFTENRQ